MYFWVFAFAGTPPSVVNDASIKRVPIRIRTAASLATVLGIEPANAPPELETVEAKTVNTAVLTFVTSEVFLDEASADVWRNTQTFNDLYANCTNCVLYHLREG
jgi:hypothetical protein